MVFADLVGSTELAAGADPEELRARLEPFFVVARDALSEHGGNLEKYVGDAVLGVFGVPRAHGDDPDRAVAAALAVVERVKALEEGLTVRIGIEAGEVLASETAGDLSVTGEAVNAAARLQAAAEPGEVLVGERAARSSRAAELERCPPINAKGFPAPLAAWRAVGMAEAPPLGATPFVGRDDDLELLRITYRRAVRQATPELVAITGESGIGKTRLANELFEELRERDDPPRVLLGRNPPYGRGIAFWALSEILRQAAGVSADAPIGDVRIALAKHLSELGAEDAGEVADSLAVCFGGSTNGDVEDGLRRGWRRLVALLAGERPLVIGIDDAHWADDGLLDLIEGVTFGLEEAPLLVLCTSRPELLERRPGFGRAAVNVTRIQLAPLSRGAAAELARALLPESADELASRVADRSGGNPFFAEEVTRRLAEDVDSGGTEQLPETVQAAIAARIDLLEAPEKRAIQYASVLGPGFLSEALADLLGGSPEDALDGLVRKALVQERLTDAPGRYAFRHTLIRDVAYASLPRAERATLHERAAAGILGRADGRYSELVEIVAFHRIAAEELDPTTERRRNAFAAIKDAAETVARRGASSRAQELYEQAAETATETTERLECLRAAADVAVRRFRGEEALRLRRKEAKVAERAGDGRTAAAAYAHAVQVTARMGGVTGDVLSEAEMVELLRRGRELVAEDDTVTRARLLLDEAWISWRFDRPQEMAIPAREGLELARQTDDPGLLSNALDAVNAVDWLAGDYASAAEGALQRLDLLDGASGHEVEFERSDALHMTIESLTQAGDLRRASAYAQRAREADLARGILVSGWSRELLPAFFLGRWDEVLEMGERVRQAWIAEERPTIGAMKTSMGAAAAVQGYRGEDPEAAELFALTDEVAEAYGGQAFGVEMLRADVHLHQGRFEAAVERVLDPEGGFWWTAPYLATRAEVFVVGGHDDAEQALEQAAPKVANHPYARAVWLRAGAQRSGDEEPMREALATFRRIECPYQEARTAWLLDGAERTAAERIFKRLGVAPPARRG